MQNGDSLVPDVFMLFSILSALAVVVNFMMHRRPVWPPLRLGIPDKWEVPGGPIVWKGTQHNLPTVEVHVDGSGYFSVKTKAPVAAGDILVEFAGEVHDVAKKDDRATNWFLAIAGHRGDYVLDGQIRGKWTLRRYLTEKKVASFVNSSQVNSGTNNYTAANAEIEWEVENSPHACRAILRAKHNIDGETEILWNYPWV